MTKLRKALIEGSKSGTLLETVYAHYLQDDYDDEVLATELAALHNESVIDVIAAFGGLTKQPSMDFFSLTHVFETTLPLVTSPVEPVLACVLSLYRRSGPDLAAGGLVDGFMAYCEKDPARPNDALAVIEHNSEYLNLLAPTLIAGSRIDSARYLGRALRLAVSGKIEVRRCALFSLANIAWPKSGETTESAYIILEKIVAEDDDDELLATSIRAAYSLLRHDDSQEARIIQIMDGALKKGGENSLHAASYVFGFHTNNLSDCLFNKLFSYLSRVQRVSQGSINNIGRGISSFLKTDATRAIEMFESFLLVPTDDVTIESFGGVLSRIRNDPELVNRIVTRWFATGEQVLCEAVKELIGVSYGVNHPIQVDPSEWVSSDKEKQSIFIARKAIGYLFFNPISAASLVISLMRGVKDSDTINELGNLLTDPLLLNFTGEAHEYVTSCAAKETGTVRGALTRSLTAIDEYIETLTSIGELPELRPSEVQREAYHRKHSREMTKAMEDAESKSVLLAMIDKQVILYGRSSISYVYGPDGESSRVEIQMGRHETSFELPRLGQIDPFGLEYTLRIFRSEQMQA